MHPTVDLVNTGAYADRHREEIARAQLENAAAGVLDVDLMVSAPLKQLNQLVREVQSWQVYITPFEPIVETNLSGGMPFNIIDGKIGTKADLYIAQNTGLDASAMARRRRLVGDRETGAAAWFLSPEDVILYKLSYYRQGGEIARKHPTDIANMLDVIGSELDLAYLSRGAAVIGVADLWQVPSFGVPTCGT